MTEEEEREENELIHFYQDKELKLGEEIAKLKAQIEKMKCCYNCKYRCFEKCIDCQRGFYDGKNDHWELAE